MWIIIITALLLINIVGATTLLLWVAHQFTPAERAFFYARITQRLNLTT